MSVVCFGLHEIRRLVVRGHADVAIEHRIRRGFSRIALALVIACYFSVVRTQMNSVLGWWVAVYVGREKNS